jgi:hypothetical protein
MVQYILPSFPQKKRNALQQQQAPTLAASMNSIEHITHVKRSTGRHFTERIPSQFSLLLYFLRHDDFARSDTPCINNLSYS